MALGAARQRGELGGRRERVCVWRADDDVGLAEDALQMLVVVERLVVDFQVALLPSGSFGGG
eukprot:CAMPEP_0175103134 /NCGR_PEP_ID=MMETSP0086_2-20121207/8887_1 /TAXON_ID=136419 /ORGANISM="Unknown Unknown, Strain D1" /LENGTH=61 /DNA_ID=CAMNT_0016378149 /DNA_START=344 /DNA_END=529 /DNA_ORIENTATION=-